MLGLGFALILVGDGTASSFSIDLLKDPYGLFLPSAPPIAPGPGGLQGAFELSKDLPTQVSNVTANGGFTATASITGKILSLSLNAAPSAGEAINVTGLFVF